MATNQAVQDAMLTHVTSSEFAETSSADIDDLTQHILVIEKGFGDVGRAAVCIDKQRRTSYAPEWRKLHKDFTTLILDSRSSAVKLNGKITGMLEDLFPVLESREYDMATKIKSLGSWIKSLSAYQTDAKDINGRFVFIKDNVESFRLKIKGDVKEAVKDTSQAEVEEPIKRDELRHEISQAEERIRHLGVELDSVKGCFSDVLRVFSRTFPGVSAMGHEVATDPDTFAAVATCAAIVDLAIFSFTPNAAVALLVVGLKAYGLYSQTEIGKIHASMRGSKKDLSKAKKGLDNPIHSATDFQKIISELNAVDTTLTIVVEQIGSIHTIWNALGVEAQKLRDDLKAIVEEGDEPLLRQRMNRMRILYTSVRAALEKYALKIDDSGYKPKGTLEWMLGFLETGY